MGVDDEVEMGERGGHSHERTDHVSSLHPSSAWCLGFSKKTWIAGACFCAIALSVVLGVLLSLKPSNKFFTPPPGGANSTYGDSSEPLPLAQYRFLPYSAIVQRVKLLATQHPDFVEIYTTQERYGLGSAGSCEMEPGAPDSPCLVYVMEIGNKALRTSETPTVFFSGTLHGDERVGPTTTIEFATWLLQMYSRHHWVRMLVDTRKIIIMPAANALGYAKNTRTENDIDPNRDFAWDQDPLQCMRTIAARSINEVWKRNIVQLSITFHGGDHLIAYPWGDSIHCPGSPTNCQKTIGDRNYVTADNTGMKTMVDGMREFIGAYEETGKSTDTKKYLTGIINDPRVIYAVNGGMEDWAYGASWAYNASPGGKVSCTPTTFGGYAGKTTYNDATNRAVNLLVETAFLKAPGDSVAGWNDGILAGAGGGQVHDGHVTRNIRLCLYLTDLLQPWVRFVPGTVPSTMAAGASGSVQVEVGGVVTLDEARVTCEDAAGNSVCAVSSTVKNKGVWGGNDRNVGPYTLDFTLDASAVGSVTLRVLIKGDQSWAATSRPEAAEGLGPPETHFVSARTDDTWDKTNPLEGARVLGHLWWSCPPQQMTVTSARRTLPTISSHKNRRQKRSLSR